MAHDHSLDTKMRALVEVARFRPLLITGLMFVSLVAALLEGVGLSFIFPIISIVESNQGATSSSQESVIIDAYQFLGVPPTLEYVVAGAVGVLLVRYSAAFLVSWLRATLQVQYVRHLQTESFDRALDAQIRYFDQRGSNEILNAIITQAVHAGYVINYVVKILETSLVSLVYLGIAFYLAPQISFLTVVLLGCFTLLLRRFVEPGYELGDAVATANERVQQSVQAGTQGIRDVKLFDLADELFGDFQRSIDQFAHSRIRLKRNEAAIENTYRFMTVMAVFVLIYFALTYSSLSLAGIGLFLFSMFRLAPRISTLNNLVYQAEGDLPHLVQTQQFIDEIESTTETTGGERDVPQTIDRLAFDDVGFAYDNRTVIDDLSFEVTRGEFVAFVGQSGAGKSTIVSLLARLYEPTTGTITANGVPIDQYDLATWRRRVSVVRQDPYVFDDTLRYNLTIGKRDATQREIDRVCRIACVDEFLEDLPNGLDTTVGDDGVRLSGGQRQRVAIARALLKDAELLVLDEATSDLDSSLESEVHAGIEAMERDYAILVIAHRLSTINNADRIFTMADGRIIEAGDHDTLMAGDSTYAELYSHQSS